MVVLEYRSTTDMGNAHALSRLSVDRASSVQGVACDMLIDAHQLSITSQQTALYKRKDPLLSKLLQGLISGKNALLFQAEFCRCTGRVLGRKGLHIERSKGRCAH